MAQTELKPTQLADSPAANEVLTTDGDVNEWTAVGALVAPGNDTEVIFNDGGVLNGEANCKYSKVTKTLLMGSVLAAAGISINTEESINSGTSVTAATSITATTHVETKQDIRITSAVANSGGGLVLKMSEASSGILSGATDTIEVNIPTGAIIVGCQLRNDEAITGIANYDATYSGGALNPIVTGATLGKNDKFNSGYDVAAGSAVATSEVDITLTANGGFGTFTDGEVRAIVYYYDFIAMDDNP